MVYLCVAGSPVEFTGKVKPLPPTLMVSDPFTAGLMCTVSGRVMFADGVSVSVQPTMSLFLVSMPIVHFVLPPAVIPPLFDTSGLVETLVSTRLSTEKSSPLPRLDVAFTWFTTVVSVPAASAVILP